MGRGAEVDEPAAGLSGMTALIWGLAECATFSYIPCLLQDIYLLSSSNELSFGAEYRRGPINSGHQDIFFHLNKSNDLISRILLGRTSADL